MSVPKASNGTPPLMRHGCQRALLDEQFVEAQPISVDTVIRSIKLIPASNIRPTKALGLLQDIVRVDRASHPRLHS